MPCGTRRGLLVKVDFHCYATMEIHLKWNRSNLWKAARKIKSWARFNFYVYAWPSMHCLFFIYAPTRNIKVTRQWKYILTRWDWTELLNKMPGLSKTIKCLLNAEPFSFKKRDPDCQKQRSRVLWPSLTQLTWLGEPKCLYGGKWPS